MHFWGGPDGSALLRVVTFAAALPGQFRSWHIRHAGRPPVAEGTATNQIATADFSRLVGSIYDCALDPALWYDVLEGLSRELGFRMSSLILAIVSGSRVLLDVTCGSCTRTGRVERCCGAAIRSGCARAGSWLRPG